MKQQPRKKIIQRPKKISKKEEFDIDVESFTSVLASLLKELRNKKMEEVDEIVKMKTSISKTLESDTKTTIDKIDDMSGNISSKLDKVVDKIEDSKKSMDMNSAGTKNVANEIKNIKKEKDINIDITKPITDITKPISDIAKSIENNSEKNNSILSSVNEMINDAKKEKNILVSNFGDFIKNVGLIIPPDFINSIDSMVDSIYNAFNNFSDVSNEIYHNIDKTMSNFIVSLIKKLSALKIDETDLKLWTEISKSSLINEIQSLGALKKLSSIEEKELGIIKNIKTPKEKPNTNIEKVGTEKIVIEILTKINEIIASIAPLISGIANIETPTTETKSVPTSIGAGVGTPPEPPKTTSISPDTPNSDDLDKKMKTFKNLIESDVKNLVKKVIGPDGSIIRKINAEASNDFFKNINDAMKSSNLSDMELASSIISKLKEEAKKTGIKESDLDLESIIKQMTGVENSFKNMLLMASKAESKFVIGFRNSAADAARELMKPFESMVNWIESLPGGRLLSDLFDFSEISDRIEKDIKMQIIAATKSGTINIKAFGGITKSVFSSIGEAISKMFANPLLLVIVLIGAAFLAWRKFYGQTKAIRDETGLLADNAERLSKEARNVVEQNKSLGVSYEIAGKAVTGLFNEFQNINMVTPDLIEGASVLSGAYGLAAEDAAKLLRTLKVTGGLTDKQAKNMSYAIGSLANLKGVAPQKVLQDMAKSSKEINLYFRGNVMEAAKASIELQRMGLNLQKAAGIAKNLLEFDTSIESELEASVLMNRQINLSLARQKAFMGDIEGATREVLRQVGDIDDFNNMNVLQKEAIAKAAGMEVDELANALQMQKDLSKLTPLRRDELEKINTALKEMRDTNKDLVKDANRQLQTEKLMNTATEVFYNLISGLMPIFDIILDVLNGISWVLGGISSVIKSINSLFGGWGKAITIGFGALIIFAGPKGFGLLKKAILESDGLFGSFKNKILDLTKNTKIGGFFSKLFDKKPTIKNMKGVGVDFGKDIPGTTDIGKKTTKSASVLKRISTMIKDFSSVIQNSIKLIFDSITTAITGISKVVNSIVKLVTSAFTNLMSGLAKGIKVFIDTLGKIKPQTALQAAFALTTLAGALYLFSLAVRPFADIEWETLAKGGASLLGLAIIAKIVGNLGKNIIKGAIAVAILGAALIPLAFAMSLMKGVDGMILTDIAIGILAMTGALFALGSILWSGVGAAILGVGLLGMIALAGAIALLGMAFNSFPTNGIDTIINMFAKFGEVAPNLLLAAAGIAAIGYALAAFGVGSVFAGIGSFIGNFLGGDPIEKLERLAKLAPQLDIVSTSMEKINAAFNNFKIPDFSGLYILASGINAVNESLSEFGSQNIFESIGNAFSSAINGDPINKLERLAWAAPGLSLAATSINNLNSALAQFVVPDIENIDSISEIGEMALKQNVNQTPTVNVAPPVNDELIKKLDQMVDAIDGMKVYMDSKEVGKVISENADKYGRG